MLDDIAAPEKVRASPGNKGKVGGRAARARRRARGRERLHPAQAGHDVRDPEEPGGGQCRHCRPRRSGGAGGRLRLPALAGGQLPARPRRHLCLAAIAPPLRPAHRRHRGGRDPRAQVGRALLRAHQGHAAINFEDPEAVRHKHQFRQSDAALSRRAPPSGDRRARGQGPEQGLHHPRHRPRRAARQGPAGADRGPAAHRQDHDAAEHRPCDLAQPPGGLPHRAAHRRAARGGHRHAALGARRGHLLHLRRAGDPPCAGRPRWCWRRPSASSNTSTTW